jgi:hypothetical protein
MDGKRLETAKYHADAALSDSVDCVKINGRYPRALRIGAAGNVVVVDQAGTAITYAVSTGEVLEVTTRRVNNTSTTATGIVLWY